MNVDTPELSRLLSERLRLDGLTLEPVDVVCAWPVYRATAHGVAEMFVKVTEREAARRTLAFLGAAGECPFLPKPILAEALDFGNHAVICLEWKPSTRVDAEDMTEGQLGSFAEGCRRLAEVLGRSRGPVVALAAADSPEGQYAAVARYAERHPVAGRLLKPLLSVPEAERSYAGRRLVPIHGDLQSRNYGFDGDRFAAVYDVEDLTKGLACEDAAYAFTERARRSGLSASARRRLTELFLRLVGLSPWPKEEWLVAVNRFRLRIASRRLEKRPDSVFVAFDIARRDRPLRALATVLKGASC